MQKQLTDNQPMDEQLLRVTMNNNGHASGLSEDRRIVNSMELPEDKSFVDMVEQDLWDGVDLW